jgi:hypothetical protein
MWCVLASFAIVSFGDFVYSLLSVFLPGEFGMTVCTPAAMLVTSIPSVNPANLFKIVPPVLPKILGSC